MIQQGNFPTVRELTKEELAFVGRGEVIGTGPNGQVNVGGPDSPAAWVCRKIRSWFSR